MNAAMLKRQLAFRLRRLGLPGMLALAMIAGTIGYLFAAVLPARAHNEQLERQLAEASTKMQVAGQAATNRQMTPTEQLLAFYQTFPKGVTIPDWLGKIYAIADEQKLDLEIGEYSLVNDKSSHLEQFRITFPVKGAYPQIRKFIGAALATAPALALDSISLKRDKVGDGLVEARIVFLLYLEKGE